MTLHSPQVDVALKRADAQKTSSRGLSNIDHLLAHSKPSQNNNSVAQKEPENCFMGFK